MRALVLICLLLSGCALQRGRISTPLGSVVGVKDAGAPAKFDSSLGVESLALPVGSTIITTRTDAQPAVAATETTPAREYQPAQEKTEIVLSAPSELRKNTTTTHADTGVIDTTVAKHRIDVEDRAWLKWAAIGMLVAGVLLKSVLPQWPAISNGLLLSAALAFASWKLAEIPAWLWAAGLVIGGALALGYKRAEWDKNGDGVPDLLQRSTNTTVTTQTKSVQSGQSTAT